MDNWAEERLLDLLHEEERLLKEFKKIEEVDERNAIRRRLYEVVQNIQLLYRYATAYSREHNVPMKITMDQRERIEKKKKRKYAVSVDFGNEVTCSILGLKVPSAEEVFFSTLEEEREENESQEVPLYRYSFDLLSPRQLEVVEMIGNQNSFTESAKMLKVSRGTIAQHIYRAKQKCMEKGIQIEMVI